MGLPEGSEIDGLVRLCQTICMVPRAHLRPLHIAERRRFFNRGIPNTHWPKEARPHSTRDGNGRNIVKRPFVPPILTDEQERLLGLERDPNCDLLSVKPA